MHFLSLYNTLRSRNVRVKYIFVHVLWVTFLATLHRISSEEVACTLFSAELENARCAAAEKRSLAKDSKRFSRALRRINWMGDLRALIFNWPTF